MFAPDYCIQPDGKDRDSRADSSASEAWQTITDALNSSPVVAVDRPSSDIRRELVFLDTALENHEQLLGGLRSQNDPDRQLDVVLLTGDRDGIQQISEAFARYDNVDAIHIVSHGANGAVKLGNTWLSLDNVDEYTGQITFWNDSLTSDADLLFYGCDLASNPDGKTLVELLGKLCDCDVAGSTDETGHVALGGNWNLEYRCGQIETAVAFSADVQNRWTHVMALETVLDQFDAISYSGNNGTQTWTTNWTEIGDDGTVSGGEIFVEIHSQNPTANAPALKVQVKSSGKYVFREANLSTATTATLSYAFRNEIANGGVVELQVSSNGGGSWTTLKSYTDANIYGSESIDIASFASVNTQIRFIANTAGKKHFRIDDVQIAYGGNTILRHWKFDEGSGSTAADSSVSANDATLQGGATWTSDCAGNFAIEFDGSGAYAITPQPFSPPSTGSVAFWMRGSGTPSVRQRLFGVNGNWEVRQETNGMLSFDLGASPFVGNEPFSTLSPVDEKDRWYHIVAVFDATDDSFSVYVDGALRTSGTSPVDLVPQTAGLLSFGTRTGSTEYWEGALRDFRVYGNKLTAEEVAELYGILAYWKLDETSGSVAVDSSGRGNDATYVGAPTLGVNGAFPPQTNTAVLLDGASQYVNSNQSLLNDVTEFTLAGWFNPTSLLPVKSYFGQNGLIEVGIDVTTNQIELWTSQGGVINASNLLSPGKWKHIAAVGNGSSLTLYVDGREVATGGSIAITYGSNAEVFKIGEGVMDVSGGYFDGRLDDVRVYSRAMCPEEINAVYKGGRPPGIRILQWLETR